MIRSLLGSDRLVESPALVGPQLAPNRIVPATPAGARFRLDVIWPDRNESPATNWSRFGKESATRSSGALTRRDFAERYRLMREHPPRETGCWPHRESARTGFVASLTKMYSKSRGV